MPLLGKRPFQRQKPPPNLKPDEQVFYCRITKEAFRDYEEMFARVIQCNSCVWTCALTGRPNLTFQEALDSEEMALRLLSAFPNELKCPLLYLALMTQRSRLSELCDDVFAFARERFFVGEIIEACVEGERRSCKITRVIGPKGSSAKHSLSPSKKKEGTSKNENSEDSENRKIVGPDPTLYKYEVVDIKKASSIKYTCTPEELCRKKGSYTKERNKLFLKQHVELKEGVWKVKEKSILKFNLNNTKFEDICDGPMPYFCTTSRAKSSTPGNVLNTLVGSSKKEPKKDKEGTPKSSFTSSPKKNHHKKDKNKEEKLPSIKKYLKEMKPDDDDSKHKENKPLAKEHPKPLTEEEKQKKKEELKQKLEEEKQKRKEERLKEQERKREEKRLLAQYMIEWNKPRDDLECDDLKDLPPAIPVDCSIPHNSFGDAIMVLEFLHQFGDLLDLKDAFPHGFSLEHLEKSLFETDIQGPLSDLLQIFLSTIFRSQEDEGEGENSEPDSSTAESGNEDNDMIKAANSVASSIQQCHGVPLRKMPLDSFTLTEVLRLHLLSSGAGNFRYQDRGGYTSKEDPALLFKMDEAELLQQLCYKSVFDLSSSDKVKILRVLVDQLLTLTPFRDVVEDSYHKLKQAKYDLKHLQWAYTRKEREIATAKYKKKLEERQKEKENGPSETGVGDTTTKEPPEQKNEENVNQQAKEKEEERQQTARDTERRKEEFLRKSQELQIAIRQHQSACSMLPVGRDRAFRRYWVFVSLPGLFVEDDDKFLGTCQPHPTPFNPNSNPRLTQDEVPLSFMQNYLKKNAEDKNNSDKENEMMDISAEKPPLPSVNKTQKLLCDANACIKDNGNAMSQDFSPKCAECDIMLNHFPDSKSALPNKNDHEYCKKSHGLKSEFSTPVFGMCTANLETCPVHSDNAPRTKWSFYYKPEDLDKLISNLNQRGFRESALREFLQSERKILTECFTKCPSHRLNKNEPPQPETRKSQRLHGSIRLSQYAAFKPSEALEHTLRDTLLEIEEKIYTGNLGAVKVKSRSKWRAAVEKKSFGDVVSSNDDGEEAPKQDEVAVLSGDNAPSNTVVQDSFTSPSQIVDELGEAILEIAQGIEPKYLHPPLGEDEDYKKEKQKAMAELARKAKEKEKEDSRSDDDENESDASTVKIPKSPLERWTESLRKCTNLPQLFVHLATLEKSVAWSRSVANARCRICRRQGDTDSMLLCDGCDRGYHMFCLKPPLLEVPSGNWYCLACKPKERLPSPVKKPITYREESSDEENDYEDEEMDEENDEGDSQYLTEDSESSSEEEQNEDVCDICEKGGTLICCDGCPLSFHLECVNPPMRRIPRGVWHCVSCTEKAQKKTRVKIQGKRSRVDSISEDEEAYSSSRSRKSSRLLANSKSEEVVRQTRRSYLRHSDGEDSLDYNICDKILTNLIHHADSWPFLRPVHRKDVPKYYDIVKRPMDLGTVRTKLNNMQYHTTKSFLADIYLIFQNCELYNVRGSFEQKAGLNMYKAFEAMINEYGLSSYVLNGKRTGHIDEPPKKLKRVSS